MKIGDLISHMPCVQLVKFLAIALYKSCIEKGLFFER